MKSYHVVDLKGNHSIMELPIETEDWHYSALRHSGYTVVGEMI